MGTQAAKNIEDTNGVIMIMGGNGRVKEPYDAANLPKSKVREERCRYGSSWGMTEE